MKDNSNIIFVLLIFFLVACTDSKQPFTFPKTIDVTTGQIDLDSVQLKYPYRIRITNTSLYLMDLHGYDYYCHQFEYPSMRFMHSFAKRGKGVNELASVGNIAVDRKGTLYLLGDFAKKIFTFHTDTNILETETELPEEIIYYPDFVLYDDSTYIMPDNYGKCRLYFINHQGKIVRTLGNIPNKKEMEHVSEAALGQAWRSFIGYNQANGILASVTQFGEVLEIFDLKNNREIIKVGMGGEPKCRYKGTEAFPDGILGYSDVYVGNQFIYALFWGHEYEKILEGKIRMHGGLFVHVFDLEGNPIKRYQLDRYITGLYINEETNQLLGTDANNEQLVIFDM